MRRFASLLFIFGFAVIGRIAANVAKEKINFDSYLDSYFNNGKPLALFLDYDGTLAPITALPDDAILPAETKEHIMRLSNISNVFVTVISGRKLFNVKSMVGIENITYSGSHGYEILFTDGTGYNHKIPNEIQEKIDDLASEIDLKLKDTCALIAFKGPSLNVHTISCPEDSRKKIEARVEKLMNKSGLRIDKTHHGYDAKAPIDWHKGWAAKYILEKKFGTNWNETRNVIFVGDDKTDEDAMKSLKGNAVTFRVSMNPKVETAADYVIPDLEAVRTLLDWIEKKMSK